MKTIDFEEVRVKASLVALEKLITEERAERLVNGMCSSNTMKYIGEVAAVIAEGLVSEIKRRQDKGL